MEFIIRDPIKGDKHIPAKMAGIRKTCPCGREFTPYREYQKFCSEACRIKYGTSKSRYVKKPIRTKVCKNPDCKKEFKTPDSKKVYCSNDCYLHAQELRHTKPTIRLCPVCGQSFISAHGLKTYCSAECRAEARKDRHYEAY